MILIQLIGAALWYAKNSAAAAAQTATFEAIAKEHAHEIQRLRDWRHDFGQKEGVYDNYDSRIEENENRIGQLHSRFTERVDETAKRIDRIDMRIDKLEGRIEDYNNRRIYERPD